MVHRFIAISAAVVALCSCGTTSLSVRPADGSVNQGVVYYLPRAEFEIALKYQLKGCDQGAIEVKISPTLTTHYTQDLAHAYVIDYDNLSSGTKTTKAMITLYENGTLQGINANAEDKTASIMTSTISAIGKIAVLSAGIPLTKDNLAPEPAECTTEANQAIKVQKAQTKAIAGLDKQLAELQAVLERWQQRAKVSTGNEQSIASLKAQLAKLGEERKAAGKQLEAAVKFLTQTAVYTFTPENGASEKQFKPRPELETKWFTTVENKELTVYAHLYPGSRKATPVAAPMAVSGEGGIVYRQPATRQLLLCQARPCVVNGNISVETQQRLLTASVQVPQLGRLSRLNFENGIYQNNKVVIAFNQAGGLTSFEQEDASSRIEGAVGNVNDAVDAYSGYVEKLNAYKEAQAAKAAEKAAINDVIVANDKAAAELASEAERIKAEIALLEAKKKLDELTAAE